MPALILSLIVIVPAHLCNISRHATSPEHIIVLSSFAGRFH